MSDTFMEALLSEKTNRIPEEYDWFSPLLGDWDFDYYDHHGKDGAQRCVKGEWIFRRVLDGAGIEDLFICPSRQTRAENPQPDGEYGATLRMFNPEKKGYDAVYACGKQMVRLTFVSDNGRLVGTVLDNPKSKWVFSDVTGNAFHWQNLTVLEDKTWRENSNVYAKRR